MNLLLLSNSTTQGYTYLEHAEQDIKDFFGTKPLNIAFIPYAGVTVNYNDYEAKVKNVFSKLNYNLKSVHQVDNPKSLLMEADAVAVGGGNTFRLLQKMYDFDLIDLIKERVLNGMPYIGWSAGSNLACPTIRTTNDMPIVQPKSFDAFKFVPFQINPHYLDSHPEGFHGETREQRLMEFVEINPNLWVVGLREGSILKVIDNKIELLGNKPARIFKKGIEPFEITNESNTSFLWD